MVQQVRAYGQILQFPDGMSDEDMAKAIQDNEHLLNPDYKKPISDRVIDGAKDFARNSLGIDVDAISSDISNSRKSIAELAEESASESENRAAPEVPGAPVRQSTYNEALLNDRFGLKPQDRLIPRKPDQFGVLSRIRSAANEDVRGRSMQENLDNAIHDDPPEPEGGFIPSAISTAGQTIKGVGRIGSDYFGYDKNNPIAEYGQKLIDENPVAVRGLEDIQDKPFIAVKEALGNSAPSMAGMVGAKALGMGITSLAPLTGPAAPIIAAVGVGVQWLGPAAVASLPSYSSIRDKQILNDPKNEADGKAKAIAALGAGAVGVIEQAFGPQQWALAMMTKEGRSALSRKFAATTTIGAITKGAIKGGAVEASEEIVQNPIEQLASYEDPTTDKNIKDTLFGSAMGALGGGVMGGTFGATSHIANDRYARILKEKERLAKMRADAENEINLKSGLDNIKSAETVDEAIRAATETVSANPITSDDILRETEPTLVDIENLTGLKPSEVIEQVTQPQGNQNVQSETSQETQQKTNEKPVLLGNDTEIVLPDGQSIPAKWAVVDADSVSASIKEGINQPRDRTRVASDIQIQGIANNPDYRRLSDSVLLDTGSPTLSHDGLIVGGNGRFEGISRSHEIGSSAKYRESLLSDSLNKGIDPSLYQDMKKPVLVRQITRPFDTRKLAVASNSGTNMQYSGLELAKIDADRMTGIEDLDIADNGDIPMTGGNIQKIRQALADYNPTEVAGLVDKNGALSQDGVRRIRNSLLAKAYGSSETLGRLVESTDNDQKNVLGALTRSASSVAKVRAEIKSGAIPKEVDVTENLLDAVETLAQIRSKGQPLDHYLAQENMFGDNIDPDSREILQFLHDNIRSQKKMAEFINNVYDQIGRIDQSTEDIFGDNVVPTKKEVIDNAKPTEQQAEQQGIFGQQKSGGSNEQKSKTETNNAASGEGQFSRSAEERLKDRERAKQLETKLKAQGYNFRITARDLRDFSADDRGKADEAATAEKIAKIFGRRVVWIEAKGDHAINGVVIPSIKDTVYIDVNTKKAVHAVLGHELSHHLEFDKPEVYKELTRSLETVITNHEEYAKAYGMDGASESNVTREIVGDIMGDSFADPQFWNRVAEANPGSFKSIADAVIAWLKKLVTNAKMRGMGSEQWVTDVKKAQDIVADAVAKYTNNSESTGSDKAKFHKVWHGSPHDHDKFDKSKIGTGEGAQAYGYGHYFASNKEVAEYYKKVLSVTKQLSEGQFNPDGTPNRVYQAAYQMDAGVDNDSIEEGLMVLGLSKEDARSVIVDAQKLFTKLEKNSGKLYEVELAPEQRDYLLWDKPLSEQSEKVINALKRGYSEMAMAYPDKSATPKTGEDIYDDFVVGMGGLQTRDKKAASDYLHELGVRGIKYLDGSSRSSGDGNFNYVIFDDNDITIEAKFSRASQGSLFGNNANLVSQEEVRQQNSAKSGDLFADTGSVDNGTELPEGFSFIEGKGLITGRFAVSDSNGDTVSNFHADKQKAIEEFEKNQNLKKQFEEKSKRNDEIFKKISAKLLAGGKPSDDDLKALDLKHIARLDYISPVVQKLFGISRTKVREAMGSALFKSQGIYGGETYEAKTKKALDNAAKYANAQNEAKFSRVGVTRKISYPRDANDPIFAFNNSERIKLHKDYKAAKSGDFEAADRLVNDLVPEENVSQAMDAFGEDVVYVPVVLKEQSGTNRIPHAMAVLYASKNNASISTDIYEVEKAFHTGMKMMERLVSRATFAGNVERGVKYVLVDDVTTTGATLADLSSYIQENGGIVVGSVLLTNAMRTGSMHSPQKTIQRLEVQHGNAIRELFGIEPQSLTKEESQYLIGFRTDDELRNSAAKARNSRSERILLKKASKPQDSVEPVSATTLRLIRDKHGKLEPWFRKSFGYGFEGLTESEARFIINAKGLSTEQVRERITEAKRAGTDSNVQEDEELLSRASTETGVNTSYRTSKSIPETISINGTDRPTRDSEGNLIHPSEEGIRNFYEWFADSKITDSQGRPLVVYHGTRNDFSTFDQERTGETTDTGFFGKGIYLTQSKSGASIYASNDLTQSEAKEVPGGQVMPLYVRASKVHETTKPGMSEEKIRLLKKNGFDAIFSKQDKNTINEEDELVVFDPSQVKSAIGNSGEFSKDSNDIKFSRAAIPETISIDGVDRPTRNSNGQLIHPTEEGIRNFWGWFSESKVTDDTGRPLVVSHYSDTEKIETFSREFLGSNTSSNTDQEQAIKMAKLGFWFSDTDIRYTQERGKGMLADYQHEFYLVIKDPVEFETFESMWDESESYDDSQEWIEELEFNDNDGVIVKDDTELGGTSYVALNPNQIKSATSNTGAFSSDNDDIRFSRRIHGDEPNNDDYVVPETPEFEGNMTGDLAYIPDDAEAKGIAALPIRLRVGDAKDIHRGYGYKHIEDNALRSSKRMPPAHTDDLAENISRNVADIANSVTQVYKDGSRFVMRSSKMNEAIISEIRVDNGEKFYSVTTTLPMNGDAALKRYGKPDWSAGRSIFPADRLLQPRASRKTSDQESQQSELQWRRNQSSKFYGTADQPKNQDKLQTKVTIKKRRVAKMNDGDDGPKFSFVANPAISTTGRIDIPKETTFRKAQRLTQDAFNRFTVIKDWLAERGVKLSEKADVYAAEERYHSRVANQLEDFREKIRNPLIEKIAKAGFTLSDVSDFLEAQHAEEANAAIQKLTDDPDATAYGITDKEAQDYLKNASPELATLANELRNVTQLSKELRLKNGLLSQEEVDAWESTYKHYIPVKGDSEANKGTGKGLKVNFKTKRRLGHGRRDEAVIENILMDHERAIMQVEKNRVAKHLVMMAAEIGMPEIMTIGQPEKRKVLKNTTAFEVHVKGVTHGVFDTREAANMFKKLLPATNKNVTAGDIVIVPTTDQRVVAMASQMLSDNEVNAYFDGHAIRIQINDELLARAYGKLGVTGFSAIVNAGRALNGYLSKVYTGYNPEFIITNLIRDFTSGVINLTGEQGIKMAAKTVGNYGKSFASLLKYAATGESDRWIDRYRNTGGNTGAAYLSDLERLGDEVKTEFASYQGVISNLKQKDFANAARAAGRKVFNKTLKWIYVLNQAGENAMRLSAFRAMIESGESPLKAASVAKNITVNFNRKGEFGAEANAAYLFFNASVQGTAAIAHSLTKGEHKYQALALSGAMTTLGYLAAAALAGGDEDEYDKLNDYIKERNMLIKSGDGFVQVPVPYGYGFFWNLGRSIADAQRKGEIGKLPWHIASSAIEELTPFSDTVVGNDGEFQADQVFLGLLPTVAKIPAQPILNKQLFSGGELMPESPFKQFQPDREKMWRATQGTMFDHVAGWLEAGLGMDVSPETLKHYTRTLTGGAGNMVDTSISAGLLKAQGVDLETSEIPFYRKAYTELTIKDHRSAFYKASEEAKKAAEEFSRAKEKNDLGLMKQVLEDKKELIALDKYANKLSKVIGVIRDEQDAIRMSDSLTAAEKRLRIKESEIREEKLYDQYLDVFKTKTINK